MRLAIGRAGLIDAIGSEETLEFVVELLPARAPELGISAPIEMMEARRLPPYLIGKACVAGGNCFNEETVMIFFMPAPTFLPMLERVLDCSGETETKR